MGTQTLQLCEECLSAALLALQNLNGPPSNNSEDVFASGVEINNQGSEQ